VDAAVIGRLLISMKVRRGDFKGTAACKKNASLWVNMRAAALAR